MKSRLALVVLVGLSVCAVGCNTLFDFLLPSRTTVRLVNNGDFPVDVELYYSDDQNTLESLLTSLGTKVEVTVQPGDTYSFSRDCEDLQAVIIDNADLNLIGSVGPSAGTDVFRDGSDFDCGDTLVFTFTHPAVPISLDINFAVQ